MGLDPGITTGIAILDANGNVLDIYSKRDMTRAEIIDHILGFGNPVIISSDVTSVPKSVEKVAIELGCSIYSPDMLLSLNEKRGLTKKYSVKNDHEVDALSAAIKAWRYYRMLFSKTDDVLKRFDKQEFFADIARKLVKEESPNIEDAVREIIEKGKVPPVTENISKEEKNKRELIERLEKNLVEKQQEIESLKKQNTLLSKALNEARRKTGLKESKPRIERIEDYQELKNLLNHIKKLRRIENKGYYPVIEIEKIDGDSIERIDNSIDLDGRLVLTEKKNLNLLNNRNIKCLLTLEELDSEIENLEFPVIQINKDVLESFDDIKAIKIDYIEKRLADAKKSGLIGWLKGYRKRKD